MNLRRLLPLALILPMTVVPPLPAQAAAEQPEPAQLAAPKRAEQFYFVLPDRFANGDPSNDEGGYAGDRTKTGYDPDFGARPLKRLLQREIAYPIALEVLKGTYQTGDTIVVDAAPDGGLTFDVAATAEVLS